ncbi:MAG TPA: spore coat protein [Thermoanaerobacterales bacterium]|jgi:spore coat protein CotF|nr:spore coat protein [Thermoanaerobacterales bacterium]
MLSTVKEKLGQRITKLSDQTIANNSLTMRSSASSAYLLATLKASTPELKQLFSAHLTQIVSEHTALMQMAINKGWLNPYEKPELQLLKAIDKSREIVEKHITE